MPIIIGTAGHVDHGKTELVKRLTGTDTDRLKEEKQRKLTIDLGFAFINDNIAIIDAPGHESFIDNMVAGASTVDYALLVVAADDSVMPQTREHLKIMETLGIDDGIVVITKKDLVDEEWLQLVQQEIIELISDTFLAGKHIFTVSSANGEGVPELKKYLLNLDKNPLDQVDYELFRVPVDRSFSIHGFGTVATGTVVGGKIESGEEVEILPAGRKCEIRGIQKHNRESSVVIKGERAALNLSGIEKKEIQRGDLIVRPNTFFKASLLTTRIYLFQDAMQLDYNDKIKINIGTGKYIGRIRFIGRNELKAGENSIAQIYLNKKIAAGFRDKFVIRKLSPAATIGGGEILLLKDERIRKKETAKAKNLQELYESDNQEAIQWFIEHAKEGMKINKLVRLISLSGKNLNRYLNRLSDNHRICKIGNKVYPSDSIVIYKQKLAGIIEKYHNKNHLHKGISYNGLKNELEIDTVLLNKILKDLEHEDLIKQVSDNKWALTDFEIKLSPKDKKVIDRVVGKIQKAGPEPTELDLLTRDLNFKQDKIDSIINYLQGSKLIILPEGFVMGKKSMEDYKKRIADYLKDNKKARVSDIRDLLGTSRKYVIPLLNYLDNTGFTYREGEFRFLKGMD